jgi:hypothetical protein
MSGALNYIAETGDPSVMMAADALAWSLNGKLKLPGGDVYSAVNHEYQVDPLQCDAPRQCAIKATQTGWTVVCQIRALHGLRYGRYKQGVLYLFPTADEVVDFSASRFKPMLKENFELIGRYVQDTDRSNLKRIGDAHLFFRAGRLSQTIDGQRKSSSKLKSISVDAVFYDEYDEMDPKARDFAQGRMRHSDLKEEFFLANPTIPDYGIDKLYKNSDQRVWMITCSACGKETCLEKEFPNSLRRVSGMLSGPGLRIQTNVAGKVIRCCVHCGGEIHPRNGRWVSHYPDKADDMVGWWISHLCSAYEDPADILRRFQDPDTDKTNFYNLTLGMAYIDAENRLTKQQIYQLCGMEPMPDNHPGPCAMGVDVGKHLHVVIGHKPKDECAVMDKVIRVSSFEDLHDLSVRYNVRMTVIDALPETREVRKYCEAHHQAFACYYNDNQKGYPKFDHDNHVVTVNRTEICDETHKLVSTPGRYVLPRRNTEIDEYAEEMCNIAKVLEEDSESGAKKYVYRKLGPDHYRHATNYFQMAAGLVSIYTPPGRARRSRRRRDAKVV